MICLNIPAYYLLEKKAAHLKACIYSHEIVGSKQQLESSNNHHFLKPVHHAAWLAPTLILPFPFPWHTSKGTLQSLTRSWHINSRCPWVRACANDGSLRVVAHIQVCEQGIRCRANSSTSCWQYMTHLYASTSKVSPGTAYAYVTEPRYYDVSLTASFASWLV